MAAKILTVFGASGQQGSALIHHVLETPSLNASFILRGVTRDASKPDIVALKEKGVQFVEADMNIRSSLDKAIAGSYAVFSMTNYWEKASAEVEIAQGKAIADAAVTAGVTQIIWSSLPDVSKIDGNPSAVVKHFQTKALVEEYIRTLDMKSTFFMPGWFMQNQLSILKPEKANDGTYIFSMPWTASTELPLIDIRDTGKFIAPALIDPDKYHRKRLTCATAFYTLAEMTNTWTKITGKTVRLCAPKSTGEYLGMSAEQKHEGVEASSHLKTFGYFGPTGKGDLAWTIAQVPEKLCTWDDFVREHEPWFL